MKPSEKEFEKICKDCYCPPFNEVLGKVANTSEYLRRYFKELGKRELKEQVRKELKEKFKVKIFEERKKCNDLSSSKANKIIDEVLG